MVLNQIEESAYRAFLLEVKTKIRSAQIKAALTVNADLIQLYWDLGQLIARKQSVHSWGSSVIEQLAKDLKAELPGTSGFSRANLFHIRKFFLFYSSEKVQQVARQMGIAGKPDEGLLQILIQIPWGHHILLLSKDPKEALFYLHQIIQYNWSRSMLTLQIEQDLFERQGKAITNFPTTLPDQQAQLAQQILKDPYHFDFLTIEPEVQELEVEKQLTHHITRFLLELGKGFAFLGRQYQLEIGKKDYYLDLFFYHIRLRCFVVIELKVGEFKPEYAGKMNFYLSAVDDLLKSEADLPSIGIILCKSKDRIEVEYALRDLKKPIGVSEFRLTGSLPEHLQTEIPSVEQFERELEET